jgi:hypothetical protein
MTAQAQMRFWFAIVAALGITLLVGVVITVVDLLSLRPAKRSSETSGTVPAM